jgi:S1-C subfamily serine protease
VFFIDAFAGAFIIGRHVFHKKHLARFDRSYFGGISGSRSLCSGFARDRTYPARACVWARTWSISGYQFNFQSSFLWNIHPKHRAALQTGGRLRECSGGCREAYLPGRCLDYHLENCKPQDIPGLPTDLQQLFGGYVTCDNGSRVQDVGGGSGFIISKDGIILTNKHVVVDGNASYTVFTNDGKKYPAKVLGRDPVQDLAVMKIDGADLPIVTLGNSDSLELGQTAIAIGNALGEFRNTVSVGVISGLGRSITAVGDNTSETIQGVVQTDAAINPGNSGGPLINLHGEVIGVNVATAQGAQSVGFALPVNSAKHDIQTALAGGQIKASYLGVRYTMLSAVLAGQKKLDVSYGALLAADQNGAAVVKDSPADKVGLKEGDVILAIDGGSLEGKDLGQVIQNRNVGDVLHLDVFRAKRTIAVDVTLGERGQ